MAVPAVIATNGLGMPVRPVDKNAPPMVISPNGLGIPVVISDLGAPFIVEGLAPPTPTMTVTGGTITPFSRDGVDYIEVFFDTSGSFTLSDTATMMLAVAGGGGAGGRSNSYTWIAGGGGAGGLLIDPGLELPAGTYPVTIGAGAPASMAAGSSANGSATDFAGLVIPGGGAGASHGSNAAPGNGASGGGARGGAIAASIGGTGSPPYGRTGGNGIISAVLEEQAGGGGGGHSGAGGNATAGVAGTGGVGTLIDFIDTPITACAGGAGCVYDAGEPVVNSPNATWGSGSGGSMVGTAGAGGNGFCFIVVRADEVIVE